MIFKTMFILKKNYFHTGLLTQPQKLTLKRDLILQPRIKRENSLHQNFYPLFLAVRRVVSSSKLASNQVEDRKGSRLEN